MVQACAGPREFESAMSAFKDQRYVLSYRPEHRNVYIMLKQGAGPADCLKAVFAAHTLLYMLDGRTMHPSLPTGERKRRRSRSVTVDSRASSQGKAESGATEASQSQAGHKQPQLTQEAVASTVMACNKVVEQLYPEFVRQAERQGWKLSQVRLACVPLCSCAFAYSSITTTGWLELCCAWPSLTP